jgi:DNA processing protein
VESAFRIVRPGDAEWPAGFAALPDPPPFLSVRGVLPYGGIAIVGARDPTPEACSFARALATALGVPIVAGLAPGIDAAAHRGALDAGSGTIAYLGGGIARLEDPALGDAIVAAGGALASECLPREPPTPRTRIRRDRLQAAHASAVVLVVSGVEGGAMQTLRVARALGRRRFACISDASGNAAALADGATPLPWRVAEAAARIRAG